MANAIDSKIKIHVEIQFTRHISINARGDCRVCVKINVEYMWCFTLEVIIL